MRLGFLPIDLMSNSLTMNVQMFKDLSNAHSATNVYCTIQHSHALNVFKMTLISSKLKVPLGFPHVVPF